MNPYEQLAMVIVMQAVEDWRAAANAAMQQSEHESSNRMRAECERFFLSGWFTTLTGLDGSYVLRRLKKEAGSHDE